MKKNIFTKKDAKGYDVPGGRCFLYPDSPTGRLSAALVEQTGRYPEKGYRINDICTESFFVVNGEFLITLNKKTTMVRPLDVIFVPPHTPYSIEGHGTVFVFIEPKWDPNQNKPV